MSAERCHVGSVGVWVLAGSWVGIDGRYAILMSDDVSQQGRCLQSMPAYRFGSENCNGSMIYDRVSSESYKHGGARYRVMFFVNATCRVLFNQPKPGI